MGESISRQLSEALSYGTGPPMFTTNREQSLSNWHQRTFTDGISDSMDYLHFL